jgi:thiol-disulfide isomerase/thioredoxin
MKPELITDFESRSAFIDQLWANPGIIIVKFGADWCGPCQMIAKDIHSYFEQMPENTQCAIVDVDVSFDLYAYLKSKKIVSTIPALLCYHKGNTTYSPNDVHVGTDTIQLKSFFEKCFKAAYAAQSN